MGAITNTRSLSGVVCNDHTDGKGATAFAHACRMGWSASCRISDSINPPTRFVPRRRKGAGIDQGYARNFPTD